MYILTEQEEGLYNLYFHSCPNYQRNLFPLNFNVSTFSCTDADSFLEMFLIYVNHIFA